MARRVFFSFHYDDVTRVNVVRNSDQIRHRYATAARFYDKSLWEEAKKQGPLAIKRMINGALDGSSVTCVLIGQHTWQRPWVRYEILKSLARGNGILAVHIHDVGFDPRQPSSDLGGLLASRARAVPPRGHFGSRAPLSSLLAQRPPSPSEAAIAELAEALAGFGAPSSQPGPNPLLYLGYNIDWHRALVELLEWRPHGRWHPHQELAPAPLGDIAWLRHGHEADCLQNVFRVYNWKRDNGYHALPDWIEDAARQVGR